MKGTQKFDQLKTKKRILVFCVPFSGHVNVLKEMMKRYAHTFQFKLVVTGWTNVSFPLSDFLGDYEIIAKEKLSETDPCFWTFPRVFAQLDSCLSICDSFKPDLIIYDFFSLEGFFVGRLRNISYWCSIPAMIGPFDDQKYVQEKLSKQINQSAISAISKKYKIDIKKEKIELISDGFHVAGQSNLIWSYEDLVDSHFLRNRKSTEYVFVGNPQIVCKRNKQTNKPLIYFSLGTVVMNNLWSRQEETRKKLTVFIDALAKKWENKQVEILFISRGQKVLEKYPKNWTVLPEVNQMEILSQASVFITHGGSNSFHESMLQKVPMVVIPFFGDQILVGKRVEQLGVGINTCRDGSIDTRRSKKFLDENLAIRVDEAVFEILKNEKYQRRCERVKLKRVPLQKVLHNFFRKEDSI